jgi:porphobilinogen synthase
MAVDVADVGTRLRRLRRTGPLREIAAETRLTPANLVQPIFVRPGGGPPEPIPSLPGVERVSATGSAQAAASATAQGVAAILLFGQPRKKDPDGTEAWSDRSAVVQAIRAIKTRSPETVVITDVCLCAYTEHGHCGVIDGETVDNDRTLPFLGRVAVAHARAGADLVAPSAMMDHQVHSLRRALDAGGFSRTGILAYSAKLASAFYGPFREAVDSAPSVGDRKGYQMDPRNVREAMREISEDIAEGADLVMVKPALPCLDIIARARAQFDLPIVAYQVSGEYAMLKAAAERGWLDERRATLESLVAIRRAGADLTITYYASQVAAWQRERT